LFSRQTNQTGFVLIYQLVVFKKLGRFFRQTGDVRTADVGISGAKERRPELDRLMIDARRRKLDVVLVARFDRFARSVKHLVLAMEEFSSLGIDFISLNESIDTSSPMGRMIFTVIGAVAELERSLIRERVVMGLDRVRKQGRALGRPRVQVDPVQIAALRRLVRSWNEIASELGIGKETAQRAVEAIQHGQR
jgi:DNA invertase Pin-like site-specific DNA recombinase